MLRLGLFFPVPETGKILEDLILTNEANIRLAAFGGGLLLLAVLETITPARKITTNKIIRWINNIGLVVLSTVLVRLLAPAAAIGVAYLAQQNHWGLLNQLDQSKWVTIFTAIILLDLSIYFQHLTFHVLPLFWRFHRVHHSDRDCDVSTGLRFHPIEIIVSINFKMLVVFIVGAPVLAVVIFETILNFMSMFTHANIHINSLLDKVIRFFIVTPNMHRIHHSVKENETNSNFGFFIPWWDKIFGTYLAEPDGGQTGMTLGLDQFNKDRSQTFVGLLTMPIKRTIRGYAINSRDASSAAELAQKNTELEIMIKNAEHSKLEAEKANQSKTVFLANMSHELMTPLNIIIGYSELLEQDANANGLAEYSCNLELIQKAGENLHSIMNRLLELSKLEAEKYEENLEDFSLDELISEILILTQPLVEANSNHISYQPNKNIENIRSDRKKLTQILMNLIDNAAKFTDTGYIRISTDLECKNEKEYIQISVEDNGIGIENDKLDHIFAAFAQADDSLSRKHGGTGIGLTVTRRLCQLLGGDIRVESQPNIGTKFTVRILSNREKIQRENSILEDQIISTVSAGKNQLVG